MQLSTIFALFCGTVIIVRFVDAVSQRTRTKKQKNQQKSIRKDWYCFFSPERLLGEKDNSTVAKSQDNQQNKLIEDRRRRVQEQRRRLALKP